MALIDQMMADLGGAAAPVQSAPIAPMSPLMAQMMADVSQPAAPAAPTQVAPQQSQGGSIADSLAAGDLVDNSASPYWDLAGGFLKGASHIGNTIWNLWDPAARATTNAGVDGGLAALGVNTQSPLFSIGDMGAGIAGTAGAGGLIGKGIGALVPVAGETAGPILKSLSNAVTSGGFSTGAPAAKTFLGSVGNGALRLAGGAINGGAVSGIIDPSTAGSGALIGGAIPGAAGLLGATGNAIKNVAMPALDPGQYVTQQIADKLGPDLPSVINNLRNAPQLVPGSMPTAAQVGGSPALVQIEKAAANFPDAKTQFMQQELQNNNARWQAIRDVAGQPGQLDQAVADRGAQAADLYGNAFSSGPDPASMTPWIKGQVTQLLKRPAMVSAMNQAQTLAANEGVQLTDANSIQGLHYAKMALDDQISNAVRTGDNNLVRVLSGTQSQLVNVMDKLSPQYAEARAQYAAASQPINTMEAGNYIGTKLSQGALDASGNPIITLPGYRTAFGQASKNAEFGISPDAAQSLGNIGADLQRASISNSVRAPGSDTNYNLNANGWLANAIYGNNFQGAGKGAQVAAAGIGSLIPGVGTLGGWLGAKQLGAGVGTKLNAKLTGLLLNPGAMADSLDSLSGAESKGLLGAIIKMPGLLGATNSGRALLAAPAVLNAE